MAVGSRVSWGAILAGAVMAVAVSFLLSLLGAAIGLSMSDEMDSDSLGTGAAVWAVVTTVVALFVGGWITSQCVVGETKSESVVHGIIMWGVVLAMLLWLTATGISSGFSSMLQIANVAGTTASGASEETWQQMAQRAGVSQDQIDQWAQQASATAQDPETQRQAKETATEATWWALGGTLLSMIAAVGGALVGAGPTFRLLPLYAVGRRMENRPLAG